MRISHIFPQHFGQFTVVNVETEQTTFCPNLNQCQQLLQKVPILRGREHKALRRIQIIL